jgi:hypothetical protein
VPAPLFRFLALDVSVVLDRTDWGRLLQVRNGSGSPFTFIEFTGSWVRVRLYSPEFKEILNLQKGRN